MSDKALIPADVTVGRDSGSLRVLTVFVDGSRAWLQVSGELDVANSGELAVLLKRYLHAGCSTLVLDVSELTFLDCAGLRALVRTHNGCLARGGGLVLRHVGPQVARLLGLTQLDSALVIDNRSSDSHDRACAAPIVRLHAGGRARPGPLTG
jgi:anti-anti-sigma factor